MTPGMSVTQGLAAIFAGINGADGVFSEVPALGIDSRPAEMECAFGHGPAGSPVMSDPNSSVLSSPLEPWILDDRAGIVTDSRRPWHQADRGE